MKFDLLRYVSGFFIIILSLPIHEFSHAYVAKILGDDSAQKKGRLTINPASHLDILGFVCVFLFGYGWAKPVPVNIRKFSNPKRDMALVSLAGPISNLMLALVAVFLCKLLIIFPFFKLEILINFIAFFRYFILLNINMFIFNLIPIPPLDGSRVLMYFLSNKSYYVILFLEKFGGILIFALVWSKRLDRFIITSSSTIFNFFDVLTGNLGFFNVLLSNFISESII